MMSSVTESRKTARIMYVISSLSVGGAERHVVAVASGLQRRGWQTSVFALSRSGPLLATLEAEGVQVLGPAPGNFSHKWLGRRLSAWLLLIQGAVLLTWTLLRTRKTVVHFFLPAAYLVGGIVACLVGSRPRIMSRRSLNRYQFKRPHSRRVEHVLHSQMDFLVGNSLAVTRELEAESGGRTPVRLIYNGIDANRLNGADGKKVRQELGLEPSALVFVIVANLIGYKGHADLLQALGSIHQQLPDGWCLMCIGRDDGILPSLQDQAQTLAIAKNVRWLGARMDVDACLAAADVAISASHEEGFSNAILEAMLAGLPMVVTDVGGNAEAVLDGVTGHVVPAHAPQQLGAALLKLVEVTCRDEMGKKGRQRVIEQFSMEACLDAYGALYEDALSLKN